MRFNFNLQMMLLIMVIFCGLFGALFYLARIPQVVQEFYEFRGLAPPNMPEQTRAPWLVFIMFTLTAPLVLAFVFYCLSVVLRWFERRQADSEEEPVSPFD